METIERHFHGEARGRHSGVCLLLALVHLGPKPENIQMATIKRFLKDETGTTAVKYSLLAALIAVVIITAVTTLGTNLNANYQSVASQVGAAGS